MYKIKKGDYVTRISYKNDILFKVDKILTLCNGKKIAILKGVTIRIEADAPIQDLKLANKEIIRKNTALLKQKIANFSNDIRDSRIHERIHTGLILHLDGDAHLSNQKKCSNINTYKQVIFNHD